MTARNVVLINASSTDIDLPRLTAVASALQTQVERDFAPFWHVTATVTAWGGGPLPADAWQIRLVDESVSGGVHLSENAVPYAEVEARAGWTLRASHELLEMLVDPLGTRIAHAPSIWPWDDDPNNPDHVSRAVSYLVEVCDPCQIYSYNIHGVPVADFVTPRYYINSSEKDPFGGVTYYDQIPSPDKRLDFLDQVKVAYDVPPGCYLSWVDPADKGIRPENRRLYQKANGRYHKSNRPFDPFQSLRDNRDKAFGSDDDDGQHHVLRFVADIEDGCAELKEHPLHKEDTAPVSAAPPNNPPTPESAPPTTTASAGETPPLAATREQLSGSADAQTTLPVEDHPATNTDNDTTTSAPPAANGQQQHAPDPPAKPDRYRKPPDDGNLFLGGDHPKRGKAAAHGSCKDIEERKDLVVARSFRNFVRRLPTLSEATITVIGTAYHPDEGGCCPDNPDRPSDDSDERDMFTFVTPDGQVTQLPICAVREYAVREGGVVQLKLAAGFLTPEQRRMFAISRAVHPGPAPGPYDKWSDTQKEPPDDGLYLARVAPPADPYAKWSDTQKEPPDDGLFLSRATPPLDPYAKWSDTQKEPPDDGLYLSRAGGNFRNAYAYGVGGAGNAAAPGSGAGVAPFIVAIPHHTPLAATMMPGAMGQPPTVPAAPATPAAYGFPAAGNGFQGSLGPWGDGMWLMMWRLPGFVY